MGLRHQQDESTEIRNDLEKPKKYSVVMHNDHYSTWEFVIDVLKQVFKKTEEEAVALTGNVHNDGSAVYTFEIAEMKVSQVHTLAKANGYPLKCTIEEA